MHKYEERMRAVELYIKLGERVRATIPELGSDVKYLDWLVSQIRGLS